MTTIETGVALPTEGRKKAAARARKPKENQSSAQGLIKALQFIGLAQREAGTNYQTHCIIHNHWAVSFDGVLTLGTKIQEDISACPNSMKLLAALQKCGANISISQLSEFVLSIKSGNFKASIDCISYKDLPESFPDKQVATLTDEIKRGFEVVSWIPVEGATRAFECCALLQGGSIVATNGHVLLEYWHGIDLPPNMLIPKAALTAIIKTSKALTGLGFSDKSVTFYFEDESFLKTQIYLDPYPNYQSIFNRFDGKPIHVLPKNFYEGVDALASFCLDKFVRLCGERLQSHNDADIGATFEMQGIPEGEAFNVEYLKAVREHFFNTIFNASSVAFSNGKVRGVVMGRAKS